MQHTLFLRGVRLTGELPKGSYLCRLPAVLHLKKTGGLDFSRPATIFVGENGTGKSTLLEALAVAVGCNPEGGSKNFAFSTVSTHSPLYAALTAVRGARRERDAFFLRAESFYNASSYVDEIAEDGPSKQDFWRSTAGAHCTPGPTAKASWRWCRTASARAACIFWTSPRPRFRPCGF